MALNPLFIDRVQSGEIDPLKPIRLWWFHFKMWAWGNKTYEKQGGGIIPCKKCGTLFQSWQHFDYYDPYCEWCLFAQQDPEQTKFNIENILMAYDRKQRNWHDTKAYLRAENIKVR